MTRLRAGLAAVLAFVAVPSSTARPAAPPASTLLDILQTELKRNVEVLKQEPVPPYFVAYSVHETGTVQVVASFGAVLGDVASLARTLGVEVRAGDYALDSTHEIPGDRAGVPGVGRVSIPLTDSGPAVALAAWRATDRGYRQAVERLARVKSSLGAKVKEEEPAPDFSREEPSVFADRPATLSVDRAAWEAEARRLSAPFAADPLILSSGVTLSAAADTRYMVTTEGTRLVTGATSYRLSIEAVTKADDGMELPVYASYYADAMAGLPTEARLQEDVRGMMDMLAKLRAAPVVEPFSGPAILSGRAAGVFFHEIFGHRIEGSRQKESDDARTFSRKVGDPILPPFLSVYADPTLERLGDQPLAGHYVYDDEGVKARRVTVVEKGVLKEFLLGRSPLGGFPRSNGHGRAEPGYHPMSRQSNLVVESSAGMPFARLVDLLKEECRKAGKPFGLLFDQVEGGFTFTNRIQPNAFNVMPIVVYRVYPDGRPPELVRGVNLIGTPLAAFGRIVATGDTPGTFNGMCGAESGQVPVSASSPALLVSEVEVQKRMKSQETLPILPAPSRR